jgi:hypothetical protein
MDWIQVIAVAVSVVGLLQWLKGLLPNVKPWVWAAAAAGGSLILAAAFHYLPAFVQVGVLALAVSQLAYETIVQLVKSKISGL